MKLQDSPREDIQGIDDIKIFVNSFYGVIQNDSLLGPIFNAVIQDRWDAHLAIMYTFWQTILFDQHTYSGRPFPPHAKLPIEKAHFDHWLSLFRATIDRLYVGPIAEEAKSRAEKMALLFQIKLDHIRNNPFKPIL
ncbi:group III truncated hemoglobin [Sphingobacterium sp. HJSM2_6]|uniref:group III truncated hemoglobin n=1 Tax=Sphingobacterium sp. HJSM2_6 TaxID=3366264 RepID=UPI003BC84DE6